MFGITGIDATPLFYGIVMFIGFWSMWHKLTNWRVLGFILEAGIFYLVFTLHGGTMAGGFAAMICALICGNVLFRKV